MLLLPRFIRGGLGRLRWFHFNTIVDTVERVQPLLEQIGEKKSHNVKRSRAFLARVGELEDHQTAPLGNILGWQEHALDKDLQLVPLPNGRSSEEVIAGKPNDFAHGAVVLFPPFGLIHVATLPEEADPNANPVGLSAYVWQPSPTTFTSKVTAVLGGPLNATYDVLSVDGSIEQSDMTPIKRWSGIDYEALNVGDTCWLNATGVEGELELLALEKPVITDCNKQPAGFADSFIGF